MPLIDGARENTFGGAERSFAPPDHLEHSLCISTHDLNRSRYWNFHHDQFSRSVLVNVDAISTEMARSRDRWMNERLVSLVIVGSVQNVCKTKTFAEHFSIMAEYFSFHSSLGPVVWTQFVSNETRMHFCFIARGTGSGSLPASPADSGVSDVESSTSSGGNEDANLLLKARLNPNSSLQPSLASHHSHLSSGKRSCPTSNYFCYQFFLRFYDDARMRR